jgi:uncharacterized protein YndB with AHSA1/START domain
MAIGNHPGISLLAMRPGVAGRGTEASMHGYVLTVERSIKARPEAIFALVSDAAAHPRFDGSGCVKHVVNRTPQRLELGSSFGMFMKMGIGYSMVNTVIEYEENRLIAWQTRPPGQMGRLTAGRIWRYELSPEDHDTTLVKESWDLSQDRQRWLLRRMVGLPSKTRTNMERTLELIEELTAVPSALG